jgi:ABC-2 type transport system permease protein
VRGAALLLRKDLRRLARSPLLLAALVVYPLLLALLVGLVVRYAGERPRVALVDRAGLPSSILLGEQRFDLRALLEGAAEVDLVRMDAARAGRELETGRVLAVLEVPPEFSERLRGLRESPRIVLRATAGALGTRVVEKVRALVYGLNLSLQRAYIDANLGYVDLVRRGGTGRIGDSTLTVLGLERAERELEALARSPDPAVAGPAAELAEFLRQVSGAVGQVGAFLRATANPVELVVAERSGRSWALSAQVQSSALALALVFVAVMLGAAAVTAEREEQTLGRLVRGLVGPGAVTLEKVALVGLVGAAIATAVAVAFGLTVELAGVAGGQPWARLPLLVPALAVASAAFGALGVAVGALARDVGASMLVALLVALPVALAGAIPEGAFPLAGALRAASPFGHAVEIAAAALYDADPWARVLREAAWLAGIAAVLAGVARASFRRLLV